MAHSGLAQTYTMKVHILLNKMPLRILFLSTLVALTAVSAFSQSSSTPREEKLLNGLKLIMFDAPASDKVTLKVRIHAGSAFDPQGKEGLMKLLAANIFPNPESKEFFADLGGSIEIQSNYDYIQVNVTSKPEGFLQALETVANAVVNVDIDKETTAKLKSDQLKALQELTSNPAYIADQAAAARLFGTFPYGRPVDGTNASITKIDFADLLDAKHRFFTSDNATVLIAGKIDKDLIYLAIRRYFGAWLKSDKRVPSTFKQPDDPPAGVQMIDSPVADKFEVRFAARGTSRGSNNLAAYSIAAAVIEDRLKAQIPSDADGTLTVESIDHVLPGSLVIKFSGTKRPSAAKVEAYDIVSKALSTPVTDAEFQKAKPIGTSRLVEYNIYDRWLDVDTYKSETPDAFNKRISSVSLANVQDVMSQLKAQPFAAVVVSSNKPSE
jgi:predicted Zn-dependent peptidase